ncbi:MAG: PD-(D/E)XK nuclease family protein [Acidobacteria bacterium]|nr:PD-(D/E)XK nuclease family protein [Acidobacteriota bacterium]
MSEQLPEPPEYVNSQAELERLVVDNDDLENLEERLGRFNIFEALGIARHELRHSDFLAFLLDPNQTHGLGDEFTRRFLQRLLASAAGQPLPVTPIDLDIWNLNDLIVLREWQNIDILLLEESLRLAVIIENKIGSTEHSNQLERYFQTVGLHHREWKILGVYLSPEGEMPSHVGYLPANYTMVCEIIERLTARRSSTLGDDVRTMMTHYTQMLRRRIVSESEIADLCRRIYRNHRKALDLIYEYRTDRQAEIRELLEKTIAETPGLLTDHCSKSYVRFLPRAWDVPALKEGKGWTPSGRVLLFEFYNAPDRLILNLHIGPGPDEVRQRLFDMARTHQSLFRKTAKSLNQKWNVIYGRTFLTPKDYEEETFEQLEKQIRKHWAEFMADDLPKIAGVVRDEGWIWEAGLPGEARPDAASTF